MRPITEGRVNGSPKGAADVRHLRRLATQMIAESADQELIDGTQQKNSQASFSRQKHQSSEDRIADTEDKTNNMNTLILSAAVPKSQPPPAG